MRIKQLSAESVGSVGDTLVCDGSNWEPDSNIAIIDDSDPTAEYVEMQNPFTVPSYTVAGVPGSGAQGDLIYVSDESGGAILAFYDGSDWRRVTDRNVVS
jgi:hypothetical protein